MKKNITLILVALFLLAGLLGSYGVYQVKERQELSRQALEAAAERQAELEFQASLDTAISADADITVPSADPLAKVAPETDPVGKTNPFITQDTYENPFE